MSFTSNLARHLACPATEVRGQTLREALDDYFDCNPRMRAYVLDDQGAVRRHVAIFINQALIRDRDRLSDVVSDGDRIFVMQALSGG